MHARTRVRLTSLALVSGVSALASEAYAFCRATTIEDRDAACGVCVDAGYPLAWEEPEMEYTFNERGFPGFSAGQLAEIFSTGFDQWQAVSCGGERVQIQAQPADGTTDLGPRDAGIQPTINVMGFLSAKEWIDQHFDTHAFALTGVRFKGSGVIAGADIWFNGGIGTFTVCPVQGCADGKVDLPNVATHEIGHFFGLAHSDVDGATMACDAPAGETEKRSLHPDDRAGLCATYPPELAFRGPYEQGAWTKTESGDSCSLRPGETGGFAQLCAGLALLLSFSWRRRHSHNV
jgi:hypothetical protein